MEIDTQHDDLSRLSGDGSFLRCGVRMFQAHDVLACRERNGVSKWCCLSMHTVDQNVGPRGCHDPEVHRFILGYGVKLERFWLRRTRSLSTGGEAKGEADADKAREAHIFERGT